MKALILSTGFVIGFFLGFWPGVERPKPLVWRLSFFAVMTAMLILALLPRTAGTLRDAVIVGRMDSTKSVPIMLHSSEFKFSDYQGHQKMMTTTADNGQPISIIIDESDAEKISNTNDAIIYVRRIGSDNAFISSGLATINPAITLPYIIGLEERARNLYFHVPMSWISILAYMYALVFGVKYFGSKDLHHDIHSSSAAILGTVFCVLATATGAIWAKFNWGSFWNWDPRQTSIFVLLLIYAAYFVLRSSIENEHQRAKLSAAYAIIAGIAAIFFVYVAPRLYEGLHPGSAGDVNSGPVISSQTDSLNLLKQVILSFSFASFTALFFWLLGLTIRIRRLNSLAVSDE